MLEPERGHVGQRHLQRNDLGAAAADAELVGLRHRIAEIGAGIRKPDDVRLRRPVPATGTMTYPTVPNGWRTEPSTLPPAATTILLASRSSA